MKSTPYSRIAPFFVFAATACASMRTSDTAVVAPDSARIRSDIAFLASDQLEGRLTGTPGNDSAAAFIARRFASLKLNSPFPDYLQRFEARSMADAHVGNLTPRATQNVVALLLGRDKSLRDEYIVVGAHYDHLGRSSQFAQDPEANDAIRNGADDNASGTAAVMELARLFAKNPSKRSLLFIAFSGEELGVLGSQWYVEHPPVPLSKVAAMVNFDMVGRLRNDRLIIYGTATASELAGLVDSVNNTETSHLKLTAVGDGFGPSDQTSFYAKDIPVLHFFTDVHEDYHRATDKVAKINASGEVTVVKLASDIIRSLADRPGHLTFIRIAPPQRMTQREGSQVYLGSVPDMAATDVQGLRLMGVRPGSPADSAGLKAGDLVIELGGAAVKDLYSYSDALYSHKPGDIVSLVVMRDGRRMEFSVRLGTRGQ